MVLNIKKKSAGLLMYYKEKKEIKVFLVHHGGPIWEGHDNGAWDLPKGEICDGENILDVAKREFYEETGIKPRGTFISLGNTINKWGKEISIWAFEGKGDEKFIKSNEFEMEWPKGSGKLCKFPEMDKGKYFSIDECRIKGHSYIRVFLDRLLNEIKKDLPQRKLF